jgi:DNA-directed RNA polymerase
LFSGQSSVAYPADGELSAEERKQLYDIKRQRQVEADSIRSAVDRWRTEFEVRQGTGVNSTPGGKRLEPMLTQWFTDMSARIKEELKLIDVAESTPHRLRNVAQKERCSYGVYLRSLEPDKLTAVTILAVMGAFSREGIGSGVKLAVISSVIGKDIQDEMLANAALKKNIAADARRRNILKRILSGRKEKDGRMRWQALVRRMQQEEPMIVWPPAVSAKVGAVLMSLLFEVGKTPAIGGEPGTEGQSEPAFQHSYQITWGRRTGLISIHPAVGQIVTKEPSADFLGRQLPMLCKPRPWTGTNEGGYLLYQSHLVRSTPGEALQPKYVRAAMENNGLDHIREGLNVLGTTGWCVNAGVLDVMLEAWNSGEGIGGLAPLEPNLPNPPKPGPEEGYSAELEWDRRMRGLENRRSGYHSVRCFQNFQLEVARAYRNEEFYLPHNLDFRGRAYPLPPYLNQMGADNARGLLLFSDAKPLGERGLRWLKVHIANLVGFDKASISEREQFTMDHLDDIIDSAEKGLHGRRWWLEAEDPWQCLAACIELKNALDQADPTQFMSRLPIHQDGSCNGLQHYAALGGDTIGAQQVNLEPSDRPSDVYTGVSDFVQEEVARDAAIGNPTARMLQGRITRRVVKQTVMTNVYGVTFMGAMKQVRRQLEDQYPDMEEEDVKGCAMYVARKIFGALSSMFNGAHEIQHWLGDCASRITQSMPPEHIEDLANDVLTGEKKSPRVNASSVPRPRKKDPTEAFKSTVIWTSPLGLPVVQPYWTRRARRIMTSLQDLSVLDATTGGVVARRKQLQAFPPNFIHSLDATHMMLSATACRKVGVTFSAVHDSFWTHASDVDSMNDILREAFVRMHSDDVVQRLAEEFKVRYGNNLFLAKIEKSSKIGKAVQALRKEKKTNRTIELLEEYKRQKLLKSDDPELQAQGRAMRTSAAVFEELGGSNDDLTLVTSLGQTDIGHRPSIQADSRSLADEGEGEGESELAGAAQDVVDDNAPEAGATKEMRKKKPELYLWLPMFFGEVPAKGEWDLTRIRKSQYFFS